MPPKRSKSSKPAGKPKRAAKTARSRRPRGGRSPAAEPDPRGLRLQKVMAAAGVASRRDCEELIATGRVDVDGKTVSELGTRVLPGQEIRIDGVALKQGRQVYYAVNKPPGVVSTNHDPSGRARVIDLLPPTNERLFCVGRLDKGSEGLIVVTNDGDFAQRLAHPKFGVEKTYRVQVAGHVNREVMAKLREGVHLAEGFARVEDIRIRSAQKQSTWLEMVLSEGKNREIRRVLARVGHKVLTLKRVAIGSLKLKQLAPGEHRALTRTEINGLLAEASPKRRPSRKADKPVEEPESVTEEAAEAEGALIADDIVIDGQRVSTVRKPRPPQVGKKRTAPKNPSGAKRPSASKRSGGPKRPGGPKRKRARKRR